VTDGRMSGASGAVPAAIHVTPECLAGGPLAKVQDGDIIHLDSYTGVLEVKVSEAVLRSRVVPQPDLSRNNFGVGRELFATFRAAAGDAEAGAASVYGGL
jgi:Dihydroxyacid dehydratase/phosphogluconate dehydratase